MSALSDLTRQHTGCSSAERAHLRRLISSWGPIADLSFADLLLLSPSDVAPDGLVVLGQIRPTTAQTLYVDDEIGKLKKREDRPVATLAFETGKPQQAEILLPGVGVRAKVTGIPVINEGKILGVVTRETRRLDDQVPSELELAYINIVDRMCAMIIQGTFPFPFEDAITEESPRVGDGALLLDRDTRVEYSSPNAVSALHRSGYHGQIIGQELKTFGFQSDVVESAFRLRAPVIEELERGDRATILSRIVPLIDGEKVTGALVLLRDVSDLRRRDRMLVSMDTTIREIHHRVKNNLQTVSSLLRIQGRRLESAEAKAAINESVRRIASIAIVHEMLAKSGGDDVNFGEVVRPIVKMAQTTLVSDDRPIAIALVGDGPTLSASRASSLAVVLTELLQNAVEHGFPHGSAGGSVAVELVTSSHELVVRVHDDGVGVADDFNVETSSGLGLTIISALTKGELGGELTIKPSATPDGGTLAQVRVQITTADQASPI